MPNTHNPSLTADRFRWLRNTLAALALTISLLTLAATTAGARPPGPDPQPLPNASPAPTIVHVSTPSGFDWGDAAIGAAAGLAISLIAVGATFTIARHREHGVGASGSAIG